MVQKCNRGHHYVDASIVPTDALRIEPFFATILTVSSEVDPAQSTVVANERVLAVI